MEFDFRVDSTSSLSKAKVVTQRMYGMCGASSLAASGSQLVVQALKPPSWSIRTIFIFNKTRSWCACIALVTGLPGCLVARKCRAVICHVLASTLDLFHRDPGKLCVLQCFWSIQHSYFGPPGDQQEEGRLHSGKHFKLINKVKLSTTSICSMQRGFCSVAIFCYTLPT